MAGLDVDALLTAAEAAGYAGVKPATISKWRERGHLPVATDSHGNEIRDERGRPRYRLIDVAKAEHGTRQRAQVMARGILRRQAALAGRRHAVRRCQSDSRRRAI